MSDRGFKKDIRPIPLTPVMSKLMEYHPVQFLLKACSEVDPSQYGCTKGASPTHALLRILQPVYQATDNSNYFARLLLVDFSKAFDHIHHPTLLQKLKSNGAPLILQNWFTAFLQNRQQRIKMGDTTSKWHPINGGVPLCGPQMFVHMVSDLHTDIPDTKFMDDTTLVEITQKCKGSQMQKSADDVGRWSTENQLGLNTIKTKEMVILFGNPPVIDPLIIENCTIERVSESKLLGVIIQDNLK